MPLAPALPPRQFLILATAIFAWRLLAIPQLGLSLYVDEAQYWTWAQHLDWGYFSKPPGVAALIAASTAFFGDGLLGVKALAMVCYPLSAWVIHAIALRLYDERTALWSAVAVLTLPMFSWLGLFVSTDALLTLFWALALLAYLRVLKNDTWGNWLLLGTLCGLGLMSKYTMVAWMLAAGLHLFLFHRSRLASPKPWAALFIALLILAPNLAWNVTNDFPTLKHTADITVNKRAGGGWAMVSEFWAAQWVAFGPVLGCIFVVLLVHARESWRDEKTRLLLWFSLPLWAVVTLQALKSNANANWAAPAFAPATVAVVAWLIQRQKFRLLLAGIAVNLALVGVTYHWPQILQLAGVAEASKKDPYTRAKGWDALGRELQPLVAAHPEAILVADNRTLLAHMIYELREINPPVAAWNPQQLKTDYYKMSTDLRPFIGGDVLFITRDPLSGEISARFSSADRIARLTVPLDETHRRDLDVYLLREFKGY